MCLAIKKLRTLAINQMRSWEPWQLEKLNLPLITCNLLSASASTKAADARAGCGAGRRVCVHECVGHSGTGVGVWSFGEGEHPMMGLSESRWKWNAKPRLAIAAQKGGSLEDLCDWLRA